MSRSRFLLLISLLLLTAGTACCGGDSCGPGSAAPDGLGLAGTGVDVKYSGLVAHANNDCPDPNAPAGVVAMTIDGTQVGTSFSVTLCIPRPDKLQAGETAQLGTDVQIMDLDATLGGGCTLARAASMPASGTVVATGVCGNGGDSAGFALRFDGVVPETRTCGAQVDVLNLALSGTVAVAFSAQ